MQKGIICEPTVFQIRQIHESDIMQIASLEQSIFSDAWSLRGITETWRQKQTLLLGAFAEEKLIGYLIVYYVLDEAEIARIAVDSSWRRKGVASGLLDELEKSSKELGITRWLLDVRESNDSAISFYMKYGFTVDGSRPDFYTEPTEAAILMSREAGR